MNGHSIINTVEATEHLKNILNLNVEKVETCAVNTSSKFSEKMEKSNSTDNFANENDFQKVELTGDDASIPIYGTDVSIISSPLHHSPSLKVLVQNVVDFGWEYKTYLGRIMTVHLSMKYLAYSIKSPVSPSGFVRVMSQDSRDNLLIRGFKGAVKDIAFAYSTTKVVLACIDEFAQLFIYEILDNGNDLINQLLLHVMREESPLSTAYHRLFWCPYLPDENVSDDDLSMLLCVIHDEKAEILRVDTIMKLHSETMLYINDLKKGGYLTISHHSQPITAAAFSPDGIALATASLDGEVKFFQISVHDSGNAPKYLHQWNPHCGKPLSTLAFLDNIKNSSPDAQFWKYAITGADNNQEIKLWSCEKWLCLQTISFRPHPNDTVMPLLKSELDLSGKYLFLSDINRKVLYVLRIWQKTDGQTFISSLTEYPVKSSVFSMFCTSICKAKTTEIMKIVNDNNEDYANDDKDDDDDDNSEDISENAEQKRNEHTIKLYWINSKSLQLCRVMHQLKSDSPALSISSNGSSQDSYEPAPLNILEPNSNPLELGDVLPSPTASVLTSDVSYFKGCDDILLTPKDFTSPSHSNLPSVNISNTFKLPSVDEVLNEQNLENKKQDMPSDINSCIRRKSSQHSSSSSPSREVAEILSPRQLLNHEVLSPNDEKEGDLIMIEPTVTSNEWPQAPDPNKEYKVSADGEIHIQHEAKRLSLHDEEITSSLNDSSIRLQRMEQEIKSLHHKIAVMSENIHGHSQSMQYVQNNLHEVGQQQKYIQNNLQNFITVATNLLTKFEQLSENSSTGYAGMENLLDKWDNNEKLRVERQTAVLSQKILSDLNFRIENSVKQEIKAVLVPHITGYMDTSVTRMQENLLQKLNATDGAIKECISKNIKNKAFSDNLAQTFNNLIQQSIHNICKDTFQKSVVPSFEKSCQYLIRQVNDIFSAGTTDYIQHLDQQVKSVMNNFESSAGALQEQITNVSSETNNVLAKQSSKIVEINEDHKRQNEQLVLRIKQTVQEEVRKALRDHASTLGALRSHTASPVRPNESSVNWDEIQLLIKRGQINEAFQQALQAMNLNLVLRLCESVTLDQVFGGDTCPLAQHVILSLIHQLAMSDLSEKTDLKVKYIEDAITSLDSDNTLTKPHIGPVVLTLEQRINAFMQKYPTHNLNRHFKRIILSSKSLLK